MESTLGRPARFERDDFLMVAAGEAARGGALSIQTIAAAANAPVGSLYHRFDSREQLLAEAWLLAVRSFQSNFVRALEGTATADQGLEAALQVPRWSRANPKLAGMLTLCRQTDFLGMETPETLRREAANLNRALAKALGAFALRADRPMIRCKVALVGAPYGAVRLFLPRTVPPPEVDDMVAAAYRAIMGAT
jgi:AcrR family transcriptional regulator